MLKPYQRIPTSLDFAISAIILGGCVTLRIVYEVLLWTR